MYNGIYDKEAFAYQYSVILEWLKKRIDGHNLAEILVQQGVRKICIYGVNGLGQLLYNELRCAFDLCFADRNYASFTKGSNGLLVYAPNEIPKDIDIIIVTPEIHFNAIMKTLISYDVPAKKIISLAMLVRSEADWT